MGRRGRARKIGGAVVISWWLIVIGGFGLVGNAYLAVLAFRSGSMLAGLGLCICFGGACVYLYRTWKYWDELASLTKD